MAKECTLSAGKLLLGELHRNRVFRITDRRDMISAVCCEHKASNQTNKTNQFCHVVTQQLFCVV